MGYENTIIFKIILIKCANCLKNKKTAIAAVFL